MIIMLKVVNTYIRKLLITLGFINAPTFYVAMPNRCQMGWRYPGAYQYELFTKTWHYHFFTTFSPLLRHTPFLGGNPIPLLSATYANKRLPRPPGVYLLFWKKPQCYHELMNKGGQVVRVDTLFKALYTYYSIYELLNIILL